MRQHRKKLWFVSTVFLFGLVGCGTNNSGDETAQNRQKNSPMSVGYYSNENHEQRGGNAIILDEADNDGPLIEIMDHSFGSERNTGHSHDRVKTENHNGYGNAVLGDPDRNYHRHLENVNNNALRTNNREENGKIIRKINKAVEKIDHVKDAETIVNRKNIIVGVQLENKHEEARTVEKIRKAVAPYANGRQIQIFTNGNQYHRIKSINDNLNVSNQTGQ